MEWNARAMRYPLQVQWSQPCHGGLGNDRQANVPASLH